MSKQIEVFQNEQFGTIRAAMRNGELWFIGKDVCSALGYTNPRKALNDHVAKEDKYQGEEVAVQDSTGREQRPIAINESGVYSLIFRSDSPKAKEFKHWMLDEVFPAVRKREQEAKKPDHQIQIFKHEQFGEIRTVMIDNEPWFVGRDIAAALGYSKPENAIGNHVCQEDKTTTLIQGTGSNYKTTVTIINESGIYALIFGSKLPKAQEFKHWVTSEVLPTIRKHGVYMTPEALEQAMCTPDFLLKVVKQLKAEHDERVRLAAENAELKPKADFADTITKSTDNILIRQMAKLLCDNGYEIGEKRLYQWLRNRGVLMKNNEPYQQYVNKGYFVVQERSIWVDGEGKYRLVHTTKVTPTGQMWIVKNIAADIAAAAVMNSERMNVYA